jgi:hypothetical protein
MSYGLVFDFQISFQRINCPLENMGAQGIIQKPGAKNSGI